MSLTLFLSSKSFQILQPDGTFYADLDFSDFSQRRQQAVRRSPEPETQYAAIEFRNVPPELANRDDNNESAV